MLGAGLGSGPLTLLQELHSSVLYVVPTEVLESVVRSCRVMHWSKETLKQFEVLVFFYCLFPCLLISNVYFHSPLSPVAKRESPSASSVVHPEKSMALPRFSNR